MIENERIARLEKIIEELRLEVKRLREIESLLRSLLSEDDVRETFQCFNVGFRIMRILDGEND